MNAGVAPPDLTTIVGQVRLMIGDTDPSNVVAGSGTYIWYSDDEITALTNLFALSPHRTAIYILRLVSMTPAMKLKKWTSADLSVDGPAITAALNKAIDGIEGAADAADLVDASSFFVIADTGAAIPQNDDLDLRYPNPWQVADPTLPAYLI